MGGSLEQQLYIRNPPRIIYRPGKTVSSGDSDSWRHPDTQRCRLLLRLRSRLRDFLELSSAAARQARQRCLVRQRRIGSARLCTWLSTEEHLRFQVLHRYSGQHAGCNILCLNNMSTIEWSQLLSCNPIYPL